MSPSQVTFAVDPSLDYDSLAYKHAYSRLSGLVIEGEQEAHRNYRQLAEMLPQHRDEFLDAAAMERRHQQSFQGCSLKLGAPADRTWGAAAWAELRTGFATAADQGEWVQCLLIQALVVECLAIALYNTYLPVADDFSRKVTETVIQDEQSHLQLGQAGFQSRFQSVKADIQRANQTVLPMAWKLLNRIGQDVARLGIDLESLEEEFTIQYGEALQELGFSYQEVSRMSATGGAMVA